LADEGIAVGDQDSVLDKLKLYVFTGQSTADFPFAACGFDLSLTVYFQNPLLCSFAVSASPRPKSSTAQMSHQ